MVKMEWCWSWDEFWKSHVRGLSLRWMVFPHTVGEQKLSSSLVIMSFPSISCSFLLLASLSLSHLLSSTFSMALSLPSPSHLSCTLKLSTCWPADFSSPACFVLCLKPAGVCLKSSNLILCKLHSQKYCWYQMLFIHQIFSTDKTKERGDYFASLLSL